MSAEHRPSLTRRVITGVNSAGRSVIDVDAEVARSVVRPTGALIMDVWRVDEVPTGVDFMPDEAGDLVTMPEPRGVCVRTAVFPPDSTIDESSSADYQASMKAIYGDQGEASSAIPGMHSTETIDIVTVVDGEIWVVMEEGETCLRTGDCLVQRGTRHAWQNRSDRPCTLSTVMMPATRKPRE